MVIVRRTATNVGLPIVTGSHAAYARMLGGFGLVRPAITNAYQSSDLGQTLSTVCFTNHYHRTEGRGIIDCYNGLGTVIDCGEHPTGLPI